MRNFMIPLAAIATLAVAAPASAQWPQQRQGNSYGQNNYGHARSMQARVDNIQRQIARLAQRRLITRNEYNNLIRDSRDVEQRLFRHARDGRGLSQREAFNMERRIALLEQKVARDVRDGRQRTYRW
jgi:hypothetical protein